MRARATRLLTRATGMPGRGLHIEPWQFLSNGATYPPIHLGPACIFFARDAQLYGIVSLVDKLPNMFWIRCVFFGDARPFGVV